MHVTMNLAPTWDNKSFRANLGYSVDSRENVEHMLR